MNHRQKCPLCRSDKYQVIEHENLSNKKLYKFLKSNYNLEDYLKEKNYCYQLRFCKFCGTKYQSNILDDKESQELYSTNIEPQKSFIKQVKNYKKNQIVRKKTAKFIKNLFNSDKKVYKVLEVGAGWGFFAHLCKEFKLEFTTLEISKDRKQFHSFLKLKSIDNFNQAIKQGTKFDLIYSNQVLEHISDIDLFIENCKKILKLNGYFIAEYPSYNEFLHYFFDKKNYFSDKRTKALEHLQLISDMGMNQLIKNSGSFVRINKLPIRKFGDRLKYAFQKLTPSKFRGLGFVILKKIK